MSPADALRLGPKKTTDLDQPLHRDGVFNVKDLLDLVG